MTDIVDIRKAEEPRDVIHRVVHLLAEGYVVGLPTETGYVAAANLLDAAAVARLSECELDSPPVVSLRGEHEIDDYLPELGQLGYRLTRRCWPGPIVLQMPVNAEQGLLQSVPEDVCRRLIVDDEMRFQWSAGDILHDVLQLLPAPLVTAAVIPTDSHRVAADAAQLIEICGDRMQLCVDEGPPRFDQPSTVVQVGDDGWRVICAGLVGEQTIARLTRQMITFVCTGNTCRSPMAEGLFRRLLSDRLNCTEEELDERGFIVLSAGLAAVPGMAAAPESVELLQAAGIDISMHASRPMTSQLVRQSDTIFTMTRGHRQAILASHPEAAEKTQLLARDGSDVSDPIGMGRAEYESCKQEIERHVRAIVDTMDLQQ